MRLILLFLLFFFTSTLSAQTWVDSLDNFAREKFLPAKKYNWTWQNAALLNVMVKQYDKSDPDRQKLYLNYIKTAMDKCYKRARGKTPNGVASALGMAFLYRVTGEKRYLKKGEEIFQAYLEIDRTEGDGVSHLRLNRELWDDTIFMVGEFLMEMYKATNDEKYLDELYTQIKIHHDKLSSEEWGLWYHGWDNDDDTHITFCSERRWADKETRRSTEIWGRGNGWVVVTLADALESVPQSHPSWRIYAGYLKEMLVNLPKLQDKATGHWFQLPVRPTVDGNYIESSCTAMFAYGMGIAIKLGLVDANIYQPCLDLAYNGLRQHSIKHVENGYLTTMNVCKGTCIGDMDYYLNRKAQNEKPYGLAMFIQFGMNYELDKGMRK